MIGCAPNWGPTIDGAYQADRTNGANLLTITGGHQIAGRFSFNRSTNSASGFQ
jgi:hypothetical protein